MKQLKATGNFEVCQAEAITEKAEDFLWQKGLLSNSNPKALIDTLVIGVYFALKRDRRLRHDHSQLQLFESPNGITYLKYQEDVSKTNRGGQKKGGNPVC